jgi:hypothetical protein
MRNFLRVFFFFVNLVEWKKGEVCAFSHTIRLSLEQDEFNINLEYGMQLNFHNDNHSPCSLCSPRSPGSSDSPSLPGSSRSPRLPHSSRSP